MFEWTVCHHKLPSSGHNCKHSLFCRQENVLHSGWEYTVVFRLNNYFNYCDYFCQKKHEEPANLQEPVDSCRQQCAVRCAKFSVTGSFTSQGLRGADSGGGVTDYHCIIDARYSVAAEFFSWERVFLDTDTDCSLQIMVIFSTSESTNILTIKQWIIRSSTRINSNLKCLSWVFAARTACFIRSKDARLQNRVTETFWLCTFIQPKTCINLINTCDGVKNRKPTYCV